MKKTTFFIVLTALLSMTTIPSNGQCKTSIIENSYFGLQSGMPVSIADFSSFGADKFRPGFGAGISAGYRFTDVWSLEMTAAWGQFTLAEQDCCQEHHYFLGADLSRYHPVLIPDGMEGYYYEELKSKTFAQKYGLQANMNILGFFHSTKSSPWRVELSPALYAVGTSSDIVTKVDNTPFVENVNKWHLGYGAQLQASYAIAENMSLGLYGGYTQLTGAQLDGMPRLHSTNNIIDAGVKFTIGFKKSGKVASKPASQPKMMTEVSVATPSETQPVPAEQPVQVPVEQPESAVIPVEQSVPAGEVIPAEEPVKAEEPAKTEEVVPAEQPAPAEQPVAQEQVVAESKFPIIYFSFNSIWIEPSERAKVKEIADMMKADKSIRVRVTGWCDPVGSVEANKRVSLQRAEAVKRVLGQWLIPADRVETVGGGINHEATSYDEARNATTIEIF